MKPLEISLQDYYLKELPNGWKKNFNAKKNGKKLLANGWKTDFLFQNISGKPRDNVAWGKSFRKR